MDTSRLERFAPLAGVAFVVLIVASILVGSSGAPEDFPAPVNEIVEYYTEETDAILASSWMALLGAFFLIWFGASVRARLYAAGQDRLGSVAFGGSVAAAAVGMISDCVQLMAALRAEEDDGIAPETATAMYDIANGIVGSALAFSIAVFIGAACIAALRSGALPKWLAIFGLITTVGLLILPIAFFVTAVGLLWSLITSIVLFTSQPKPAAAAPTAT